MAILIRLCLVLCLTLLSFATASQETLRERIHFLIPSGPGGGWDVTARGVGAALLKSGLVARASYENLSGGGGGRAIAHFVETADRRRETLLISSTPIVVRALQGIFPQSFRDLVPIAAVIADYTCFAVKADSGFMNWHQLASAFLADPRSVKVAGGSVRGSTDHFVVAQAFANAGGNPRRVVYLAYDGGGKANAALLSRETQLLSTGCSEVIDLVRAGEVRVVAVTAPERLQELPGALTLQEQGNPLVFANWRGFFGPPGQSREERDDYISLLRQLLTTTEFEEVRRRRGWVILFVAGDEFHAFLEEQEVQIGKMMRNLGFLR